MKKAVFLCFVILLANCSKKAIQSDSITVNNEQTNNGDHTNEILIIGEEKLQYFGTVFNSIINDDNVNVRAYPSQKADVLIKVNNGTKITVIGTSREIDDIDGYVGNWLNIRIEHPLYDDGWVFGKYVKNGQIAASELEIIEMSPVIEENRSPKLRATYKVNGINTNFILYPHKEEKQNFYTFAYDYSLDFFHYSNVPGSYVWYPETNELKHISYIGTDLESGWVRFTDDFKYLIEDFGTNTGPRGLAVWRVEDSKSIFSGSYYEDINLRRNTIDIVYRPNYWADEYDDEILNYTNEYKENNPVPDDMELIIVCNLNLDTGIRRIIKGQYIHAN